MISIMGTYLFLDADPPPWRASLVAQTVKNLPAMWKTWVQSLGWEGCLEKGMVVHLSILAWRIPRKEEPGGLQSMGSETVGHDRVINTHTHLYGTILLVDFTCSFVISSLLSLGCTFLKGREPHSHFLGPSEDSAQ